MQQLLVAVAALLAGSGLVFAAYRVSLARKLRRICADIKAQGFPLTLEELDAWHERPPEAENAAVPLLEAREMLIPEEERAHWESLDKSLGAPSEWLRPSIELPDCVAAKLPPLGEALSRTRRNQLAQYLYTQRAVLELLCTAAARPRFRSTVDFTQWPGSCSIDELEAIHEGAVLLTRRAALDANGRRSEDAAENLLAALGLSGLLAQEPTLIAQISRGTALNDCLDALEWCLNAHPFPEACLASLQKALEEAENTRAMGRAFAGERCLIRGGPEEEYTFEFELGPDSESAKLSDMLKEHRATLIEDRDIFESGGINVDEELVTLEKQIIEAEERERSYEEYLTEYESNKEELIEDIVGNALTLSPKQGVREELRWLTLTRDIIELAERPLDDLIEAFRRFTETRMLPSRHAGSVSELPFDLNCVFVDFCTRTRARAARVAIAAERFKQKHGEYPESLECLCPEYLDAVPADPFRAAEPLSYARTSQGHIRVWSRGPSTDDEQKWGQIPEIQFRVG